MKHAVMCGEKTIVRRKMPHAVFCTT